MVYSHIYISLAATAFYFSGFKLVGGISPKPAYLLMVFFSTLITYNVHRALAKPSIVKPIAEKELWHQRNYRSILGLLVLSVLALVWIFIFHLDYASILFLLHLALIAILYNLPDPHLPRYLQIRRIPLLKVVLVGYVWAAMSIFLPAIRLGVPILDQETIRFFLAYACFIIGITIPFDLRDLETDQKNRLVTLPNLAGIQTSKAVAILVILLAFSFLWKAQGSLALGLCAAISIGSIVFASPKRHELYFSLGIDGIIFLFSLSVMSGCLRL